MAMKHAPQGGTPSNDQRAELIETLQTAAALFDTLTPGEAGRKACTLLAMEQVPPLTIQKYISDKLDELHGRTSSLRGASMAVRKTVTLEVRESYKLDLAGRDSNLFKAFVRLNDVEGRAEETGVYSAAGGSVNSGVILTRVGGQSYALELTVNKKDATIDVLDPWDASNASPFNCRIQLAVRSALTNQSAGVYYMSPEFKIDTSVPGKVLGAINRPAGARLDFTDKLHDHFVNCFLMQFPEVSTGKFDITPALPDYQRFIDIFDRKEKNFIVREGVRDEEKFRAELKARSEYNGLALAATSHREKWSSALMDFNMLEILTELARPKRAEGIIDYCTRSLNYGSFLVEGRSVNASSGGIQGRSRRG